MSTIDLRFSVIDRARQFILFRREVRFKCDAISAALTSGSIRAADLVAYQAQLADIKNNVTNWQFGSLTDANVQAEIAHQFPNDYVDAAAVLTMMQALNTAFSSLMTEIQNVLTAASASGQFYTSDPATGQSVYLQLTSPATDTLATIVNGLIASIQ